MILLVLFLICSVPKEGIDETSSPSTFINIIVNIDSNSSISSKNIIYTTTEEDNALTSSIMSNINMRYDNFLVYPIHLQPTTTRCYRNTVDNDEVRLLCGTIIYLGFIVD